MKDRPTKGIILLAFSVLFAVIMTSMSKVLTSHGEYSPLEIVFWQGFISIAIIVGIIFYRHDARLLKTSRLKDQILRGIVGNGGFIAMYWAYSLMPMTDAATLLLTGGLMATALSAIWLKETVGIYRWAAVGIGFIGAVIAASPSSHAHDWQAMGIIAALSAAFLGGGLVNIMLRSIGKTEHALTTAFYTLCCGFAMSLPYVIFKGRVPHADAIWLIIGCGALSACTLILKTQAFRYAEASLLSPVQYTSIIWATFIGWLVFNDLPTSNVIMGATIIISSNIFVLWREHKYNKSSLQKASAS